MGNSAIEIYPFAGFIGAEVRNVDVAPLADAEAGTVRHTPFG
jgi:hypothetical protein